MPFKLSMTGLWGERTGPLFWAGSGGPRCFTGRASSLGLGSGPASPFFKPHQKQIIISFFNSLVYLHIINKIPSSFRFTKKKKKVCLALFVKIW